MSYWDETERYLRGSGGIGPRCSRCGEEMSPADDHGRFVCFCSGRVFDVVSQTSLPSYPIPQVDVSGMTDGEKAQVPPIHRLDQSPTEEEVEIIRGSEYQAAIEKLSKE